MIKSQRWLMSILLLLSFLAGISLIVATQMTKYWFFHGNISSSNLVFSFHAIFALSPVCLFFVPLLGFFSDVYQRRMVLLTSSIVILIAFIASFISICLHWASLYLLAVFFLGMTQCTIPLLCATIAEYTSNSTRYKLFGLLLIPIMFFDPPDSFLHQVINNAFSFNTLLILAMFSALIMVYIIFRYYPKNLRQQDSMENYLDNFLNLLRQRKNIIRVLLIGVFIYSWGLFDQGLEFYLSSLDTSFQQYHPFMVINNLIGFLGYLVIVLFFDCFRRQSFLYGSIILTVVCLFCIPWMNVNYAQYLIIIVAFFFPIIFLSYLDQLTQEFSSQIGLILTLVLSTMTSVVWEASAVSTFISPTYFFTLSSLALLVSSAFWLRQVNIDLSSDLPLFK